MPAGPARVSGSSHRARSASPPSAASIADPGRAGRAPPSWLDQPCSWDRLRPDEAPIDASSEFHTASTARWASSMSSHCSGSSAWNTCGNRSNSSSSMWVANNASARRRAHRRVPRSATGSGRRAHRTTHRSGRQGASHGHGRTVPPPPWQRASGAIGRTRRTPLPPRPPSRARGEVDHSALGAERARRPVPLSDPTADTRSNHTSSTPFENRSRLVLLFTVTNAWNDRSPTSSFL
jgi:hypothetical protein